MIFLLFFHVSDYMNTCPTSMPCSRKLVSKYKIMFLNVLVMYEIIFFTING